MDIEKCKEAKRILEKDIYVLIHRFETECVTDSRKSIIGEKMKNNISKERE